MFTQLASHRHLRPHPCAALLGLAAVGLLALAPSTARAQNGTPGTNGSTGSTLPGSFKFNDPNATFQGTNGGNGGPGTGGGFPFGGNGGAGGNGGTGLVAAGANANITILSGTFTGGGGGTGGTGAIARSGGITGAGGTGGAGGDAFDSTGAGSNVTILGGNFNAGQGGSGGSGNGSFGGDNGNDFSAGTGVRASIYGGNFAFGPFGGMGVGGGGVSNPFGRNTVSFALNGSNVTVYGTFVTQLFGGTPITTPTTFTSGADSFFGLLADNTGAGQQFAFTIANGGSLTLAPPPSVPEVSTTVSFGLLLAFGLGGLVVAARRRTIAP